jgi:thymidylate synthase
MAGDSPRVSPRCDRRDGTAVSEKYTFDTVSEALPFICSRLLDIGHEVGSRNGRVRELLNTQIVITDPQRREVLTINRKANVFAQIAETMWVLAGRNDIEWLSAYLPRAVDYSDDGVSWRGGYGPRLRAFPNHDGQGRGDGIDQIRHVVNLLREDPLSRRAVIAIYEPRTDTQPGKDIPCNDFIQFQSRLGALHMTVTVRSNDVMWGWSGINAFEWSTLQEIVAHLLGITVGTLTFNIGSLHLYDQHWNKAQRLEYEEIPYAITPFRMPDIMDRDLFHVDLLISQWFAWEGMCRKGEATADGLEDIEEPLFRSWAAAIAYYWQRDDYWLQVLQGTGLAVAVARTPASVLSEPLRASRSGAGAPGHNLAAHERTRAFYEFVKDLHATKHASYGDSWKKRGEKMSILANMARKVDRLGVGDEYDSAADTLLDLLVYTIKYRLWLVHEDDGPDNVNYWLSYFLADEEETVGQAVDIAVVDIVDDFNYYCDNIDNIPEEQKRELMLDFARRLTPIARDVWYEETHGADEYRGADAD